MLLGVIRGADERPRLDVRVAETEGELADPRELVRGVVAHEGQVVGRTGAGTGPTVRTSVPEPRIARIVSEHLVPLLAEADHDAALGQEARLLRAAKQLEGAREAGPGPDGAVEARHRLRVVVEHVGAGVHDDLQRRPVALEVGDQHLHRAGRDAGADLADRGGEDPGPAVLLVVAVHGGDHGVAQSHARHRVRHPARLVGVGRQRRGGRSSPRRSRRPACTRRPGS